MASEIEAVRAILAQLGEGAPENPSWEERRTGYEAAGANMPMAEGVASETIELGGVSGIKLIPDTVKQGRTLLYFHGGGYCIGSPIGHKSMVSHIAAALQAETYSMDYRMAPEAPFPAAVDDALVSYKALLDQGVDPKKIAISGDSAGGGLTLACALSVRDAGLPQPACLMPISPWVDLTNNGWSYGVKAESDPMITKENISEFAATYLAGTDAKTPLASPIFADLKGLAPILIQVGSEECLLSDAVTLSERAGAALVPVQLEIWSEMIHVWHFFHAFLTDARTAIGGMADWAERYLAE